MKTEVTNSRDLHFELETLQQLFRQRSRDIEDGTAAERAAATPQLIALADKIKEIIKAQHQLGVETNETLEKATVLTLASDIVRIITEETAKLPDTTNWVQDVATLTRSAEAADAVRTWLSDCEDKYTIQEAIARRILQLAATVKNDSD
jgi:hypothetical protein